MTSSLRRRFFPGKPRGCRPWLWNPFRRAAHGEASFSFCLFLNSNMRKNGFLLVPDVRFHMDFFPCGLSDCNKFFCGLSPHCVSPLWLPSLHSRGKNNELHCAFQDTVHSPFIGKACTNTPSSNSFASNGS